MAEPFPTKPAIKFRSFNDVDSQRADVYQYAKDAFSNYKPLENAAYRLEIADVDYDDDFQPTKADEKKALLRGQSLHRPLNGTIRLVDKITNRPVDETRTTLAHVPHLDSRGLVIRNGVIWAIRNQSRLRPGIYTRHRKDGGVETQFNVKSGRGFRIGMEPETGLFKLQIGQSTTRLYPILKAIGITDERIKEAWGEDLYNKNFREDSGRDQMDLAKVVSKLGSSRVAVEKDLLPQALTEAIKKAEVDPDVTELTVGRRMSTLDPDVLLDVTKKVLRVNRGEDKDDNRDSQAFQSIHSLEDFVKERLSKDQIGALRMLLGKATKDGNLKGVKPGLLSKNISSLFEGTGLAMSVEDINPTEIYDARQAISRLGEGGISSAQMVSKDAKNVQASYIGVIDFGRGPESSNLGLDMRATGAALKGSDNQLYTRVRNVKTGEIETISARELSKKAVAFPGELNSDNKRVAAVRNDELDYVDKNEIDYEIVSPNDMLSTASQLVPFPEGVKGQRLLMGSRMTSQALPIKGGEAPLVQTGNDDGSSVHRALGRAMGAVEAPTHGLVLDVTDDYIDIATSEGRKRIDLYNNYPQARKTFLHNTPLVKKGDAVQPGQLLAKSNFTDDTGTMAIGMNLRTAWMSAEGDTYEDSVVLSESAAKKLTHEAMYKSELDLSDIKTTKKADYLAVYADKFKPEQLANIDDDGVIKPGTKLAAGDPVILGLSSKGKRAVGALMNSARSAVTDRTQTWEHHAPGVVTDVSRTRGGIVVTVKSYDTTKFSDKVSGRYGNKGVVADIRPDDQMPIGKDGKPVEVILNSLGVVSRINPSVMAEALLGKVAKVRGQPYIIKGFSTPEGMAQFALNEALKYGVISKDDKGNIVDTETLVDPRDGRELKNIFTGDSYFMKLHHLAESKMSARDIGTYTMENQPARGGAFGSKRIGGLDTYSLVAAGATEFLKDAKLIRGQRNDDYWRALKYGETPTMPTGTFANEKFKALLKGAGVKLKEQGTRTGLAPMLDRDVDELAPHEIQNSKTLDFENLTPIEGGLFDAAATGGANGDRFAKIVLPKKIPHPMFVEPIQKILGITGKKLNEVLAGKEELNGKKGPEAVEDALSAVNIERETNACKEVIRTGAASKRDDAVKRLGYLAGLKKMGVQPAELMISKIPVIPPKYRPIAKTAKMDIVQDLNYLYHDLLEARNNVKDASTEFGDSGEEYMTMMNAAQAVIGNREPVNPKEVEQGVKGILKYALGMGDSPKFAMYARKVVGNAVDTVGRGVITSDPSLDMDEVGMPKDMAWTTFRPFIIRGLVRNGYGAAEAVKMIRDRDKAAEMILEQVVKEHPVVYNRAPSLHRYNYVGAFAKLRDDNAIGLPYHTLKGIAGDYDGDQINIHVPASKEAINDVLTNLLPSKNLTHTATYKAHMMPSQDYLAGLYLASKPNMKEPVRTFASVEDAKRAYAKGEISARTPIQIVTPG